MIMEKRGPGDRSPYRVEKRGRAPVAVLRDKVQQS